MRKLLIIFPFFLMLLILLNVPSGCSEVSRREIVALSMMIESDTRFDSLSVWLDDLNYSKFTFVLWEGVEDNILNNSTRVAKLEEYGEIIPRRCYIQEYTPRIRKAKIDAMITKYNDSLGYVPKGMMDYMPDTYTVQYLLERNFSYVQGYCFDQWVIDYMSDRGGWQLPYYANPFHVLCPNTDLRGMVVLPHNIWDWVASFRVSQDINSHPLCLKWFFDGDVEKGKDYWLRLIDYSLSGCDPFGYVSVQVEWDFINTGNWVNETKDWFDTLITNRTDYDFWTFEETATWFTQNYQFTPEYSVNFVSPYSDVRMEWYYDLESRVARIGNEVVSYVDYTVQSPDKYITSNKGINWGVPPSDLNCLDNSLVFEVDALGGGYLRYPVKTDTVTFTGDLADFGSFYGVSHGGENPSAVVSSNGQNITTYEGDLVLENDDVFLVKDARFELEGNLLMRDNSILILENATFVPIHDFAGQYNYTMHGNAKLILRRNSRFVDGSFDFKIYDNSMINVTDSELEKGVTTEPYATIHALNSKLGVVELIGGLSDTLSLSMINCNADYIGCLGAYARIVDSHVRSITIHGNEYGISFLDLIGTTYENLNIDQFGDYVIYVSWYLTVSVESGDQLVEGANVKVYPADDDSPVKEGTTDSDGNIQFILPGRVVRKFGDIYVEGYNVTASYNNTYGEEKVILDSNKWITIKLVEREPTPEPTTPEPTTPEPTPTPQSTPAPPFYTTPLGIAVLISLAFLAGIAITAIILRKKQPSVQK